MNFNVDTSLMDRMHTHHTERIAISSSTSFGGSLALSLLHLLELLPLLQLQQLQWVGARLHSRQQVGRIRAGGELSLLLHVVAGLRGNDTEFLHELYDSEFHISKDGHDFGVGHDD